MAVPSLPVIAKYAVLAFTLLRIVLANQTELIPEEAYYWTYSQHPALSYFDHPPMVAWMIWLGTALFGNTELGVRAMAIAMWPVSAWLLHQTGRLWFGEETAVRAVLLFCLAPIFVMLGFLVTPDAPLIFFWLLTLYGISQALHTERSAYWLLAGLGLGCAMLSKYTAVTLAGSLLLFLLLSAKHRHWLLRIEPYLALLLAFLVFSPVLVWNAQHNWASLLFQSTRTVVVGRNPLHEASRFWIYQVLALTPLLLALYFSAMVPAIKRGWLRREDPWNFAMSFALPLFGIFVLASFKNQGHVNWTAPAYLSWSLAVAAYYPELKTRLQGYRPGVWPWLAGLGFACCLGLVAIGHVGLAWGLPPAMKMTNVGAWKELALALDKARDDLSQSTGKAAFIIGADKLNLAASTGFYLQDTQDTINDYAFGAPGIGYRYWTDLKQFEGRPAIVVLPKLGEFPLSLLNNFFTKVEDPVLIEVAGRGSQTRKVYWLKAYGYTPR